MVMNNIDENSSVEMVRVRFTPSGVEALVRKGVTVLEAARSAGLALESPCGGQGSCRRCLVQVNSDYVPPAGEFYILQGRFRYVLACQTPVEGDCEFHIPEERNNVITDGESCTCICAGKAPDQFDSENASFLMPECVAAASETMEGPLTKCATVVITPPSHEDNSSDWSRLKRAVKGLCGIGEIKAGRDILSQLPELLTISEWKPRVFFCEKQKEIEIISIAGPGSGNYGIAVDIGTTTLAASLLDMNSGRVLSTKSCYNPQILHGEDVITRIIYAEKDKGLKILHDAVVEGIEGLIRAFIIDQHCKTSEITAIVCAGNTTMIHLLLSVPPRSIRLAPYVPVFQAVPVMKAGDTGINLIPHALLHCFPAISSFVGGDITAGVISSGMADRDEISILMDIGTNGEVVLGCREWLTTCSCSAGPAFEGGGISHGMRAATGAVHRFRVILPEKTFICDTIGGEKARGICGSGLIDVVAELFCARFIDRAGHFDMETAGEFTREGDSGLEFIVVEGSKTASGRDITISETDIANIIRSKGAIHAGMEFLLTKMGLTFQDVQNFYIAGGFGCALNVENAVKIGLLPDVSRNNFHFIGNSSLTGAIRAFRSENSRSEAERISSMMTNFELSEEPAFMGNYTAALFLPHTDLTRFPSVKGH